jgi:hypothetical protein
MFQTYPLRCSAMRRRIPQASSPIGCSMARVGNFKDRVDADCGRRGRSHSSRRQPNSRDAFTSIQPNPFTESAQVTPTRPQSLQSVYPLLSPQQFIKCVNPLVARQHSFQPEHAVATWQQFCQPENEFTCQQRRFLTTQSQAQHAYSAVFAPHSPNNGDSSPLRFAHDILSWSPLPPQNYERVPNDPRAYDPQQRSAIPTSIEHDSPFPEFLGYLPPTISDELQWRSNLGSSTLNTSEEVHDGSAHVSALRSPAYSDQTQSGRPSSSISSDMPSPQKENRHRCFHDKCERTYKHEGDLARHIKNVHKAPSAYLCHFPLCPRGLINHGFPRKDKLVDHLMSNKHGLARDDARYEATKHSTRRHRQ